MHIDSWGSLTFDVFGVPFTLSTLAVLVFGALVVYAGYKKTGSKRWGLMAFGMIFASMMLHELGHALVANSVWRGITAAGYGGIYAYVVPVKGAPPMSTVLICLAGPAVNIGIALTIALRDIRTKAAMWFAGVNMYLGMYNIMPIPPLDGGRVLWALTEVFVADPVHAFAFALGIGIILKFTAYDRVWRWLRDEPELEEAFTGDWKR